MAARKSTPPRRGMVGKISVREAAELHHLRGWPAWRIAEERSGTCPQAVVQALARYGVPRRPPEGRKVFRSDFDRARRKGWTKGQLARHLGMATRSLIRAQKRMGYSWPERDGMADKPKGGGGDANGGLTRTAVLRDEEPRPGLTLRPGFCCLRMAVRA